MNNLGPQIAQSIDILSEPIERHTIQFFANSNPADQNHLPRALGSGVLLKHKTIRYIATAAHVIENQGETHIGVYTRDKDFFEIGSSCTCKSEYVDIAIWHVEPDLALEIAPDDWWYPIEDSLFNHNEVEDEAYLIFGFPTKKCKIDITSKEILQFPFKYMTKGYSLNPHSQHASMNGAINLLLEFHKEKVQDIRSGRREHAPYPYGMSGCGLWYFDGQKFRLVGIMTEWKQPTEKIPALMATKIDYVLDAMLHFESFNPSNIQ